jgi:hypothetical protein
VTETEIKELRWHGHINPMEKGVSNKNVLNWLPYEGCRKKGEVGGGGGERGGGKHIR